MNFSVIGLGKLGLPFACVLAAHGYMVYGVDNDRGRIRLLQNGGINFFEPLIHQHLLKYKSRIILTSDLKRAIKNTGVTFIVVPTPSRDDGGFSNAHILEVCKKIAAVLKASKKWRLIVIVSTVSPTSMDKQIRPLLEKLSGKKARIDFGLCYSPELIALGSVIYNLTHPDFVIIGESDKKSGAILSKIRKSVCKNNPPVNHTNFINTELIKLSLNSYITTKISFANMVARICESTPGADADVITSTLGLDSRIGKKYLKGGLSYGGPCFPRDNRAFAHYIQSMALDIKLPLLIHDFNKKQMRSLVHLVTRYITKKKCVGILGLSYKPDTDVIDESQGMLLARHLEKNNIPVIVYDPAAMNNAKKILDGCVKYAKTAADLVDESEVIIIATPWEEFKQLNFSELSTGKRKTVIDCWRIVDNKYRKRTHYVPLGKYLPQA